MPEQCVQWTYDPSYDLIQFGMAMGALVVVAAIAVGAYWSVRAINRQAFMAEADAQERAGRHREETSQ